MTAAAVAGARQAATRAAHRLTRRRFQRETAGSVVLGPGRARGAVRGLFGHRGGLVGTGLRWSGLVGRDRG